MFLDPGMSEKQQYYPSSNPENEAQETEILENEVQKGKEEVREDVVQHPEFSNIEWNVASKVSSGYTDVELFRKDSARYHERLKSKPEGSNQEYVAVWENKIRKGFDDLIKALEENKYFDDCKDEPAKNQKVADVLVKYSKEVHTQYEKYIWSAGNKTFNSIKDTIFWPNSEDYPANKIYKKLTWAATISKVDRTYVEWYEADILDWKDDEDKDESMSDRQNRNFLSDNLPQYLRNIKKTSWFVKAFEWLPIFSAKEDRPSKVDRKAIRQFLKTSSKINVEWNKDKAVALMEALHDNRLNTNSVEADFENVLNNHGITVDKKYLDDVVKAGAFYINTQRTDNSARNQHAIYLSVLKIIESEGSVDGAVKKFQSIVEQGKKDKKTEKKEWYKSGEKLAKKPNAELYDVAKNLWITDFTSATRLSEKDTDYFKNTPVEKILANLNNDRVLDARDTIAGWSKTWLQFLEIFNQVWKEKALSNLVEHAKLLNKTLWVWLHNDLLNADTIEADIKWGNTWLILLLQDIINKPGEDLYTLLSGHSENPFEGIDLVAEKASADKAAAEMISKMDKEALKKDGLTLPTPESMQSWLATALYTEYKRGIWLWGKVSFDQWIKWVEMNTWFQVRDDGTVILWIWLDYRKKINLWKWWSTTPELSAWGFIPLGMWKPELSGSIGLNDEVAKEWITKKWIKEHLWVQGGITLMPAGVIVLSAWLKWEQDKLAWIETAEQKKMVEFRDQIVTPVLKDVLEKRKMVRTPDATKLNFYYQDLVNTVKESILNVAKAQEVPEDKQEMVTNAVMRLLVNYNNADLAQESVIDIIAQWVAEQYAMAWAEDRKAHITDKAYLSWASLGAFWVAGSPLVWAYAWIKFTKHDLDGYGDRYGKEYSIDNSKETKEDGIRTSESLKALNTRLWLSEWQGLSVVDGNKAIRIPKSIKNRVKVSESMRGLLVKDGEWNILVSPWTKMGESIVAWSATQSRELLIGERKNSEWKDLNFVSLDMVKDEWFASNIDEMSEKDKELFYTPEKVVEAINYLKNGIGKEYLKDFNPTINDQDVKDIADKSKEFSQNKKVKITIERQSDWKFNMAASEWTQEWRWFELEYKTKLEMLGAEAAKIAKEVYAEALKVENPKVLNEVKHEPWDEWTQLESNYDNLVKNWWGENNENEKAVKDTVKAIFAELDKKISWANFWKSLGDGFDNLTGDALIQTLMSIKNIFARSKQVRWWSDNYEFKRPNGKSKEMKAIIKERYKILNTLKSKLTKSEDAEAVKRYESLFNATSKYVENGDFAKTSAKAAQLGNTVWFNLWDKTNPENPLFNPEIYDPMVELDKLEWFSKDAREWLHERTMRLFAGNKALINPILKALWLEGKKVEIKNFKMDGEKWKLELDIWWKKVTLSAWMKFWFFTQCVNHTIILSDISAESEGMKTQFSSGVWENGRYVEGDKSSIISTTEVGASVAITLSKEKSEPEEWDGTTNMEEDEEDIENDETTIPWKDDNGKVNTWWKDQWWKWDSGKQWGWREWDEWGKEGWDNTPPTWGDWQSGHQWGWRR